MAANKTTAGHVYNMPKQTSHSPSGKPGGQMPNAYAIWALVEPVGSQAIWPPHQVEKSCKETHALSSLADA